MGVLSLNFLKNFLAHCLGVKSSIMENISISFLFVCKVIHYSFICLQNPHVTCYPVYSVLIMSLFWFLKATSTFSPLELLYLLLPFTRKFLTIHKEPNSPSLLRIHLKKTFGQQSLDQIKVALSHSTLVSQNLSRCIFIYLCNYQFISYVTSPNDVKGNANQGA